MSDDRSHMDLPTNPEDFYSDDRISFSKADSKFIAVVTGGDEYEFDHTEKRWVPATYEDGDADELPDPNVTMPSNKRKAIDDVDQEVSRARI